MQIIYSVYGLVGIDGEQSAIVATQDEAAWHGPLCFALKTSKWKRHVRRWLRCEMSTTASAIILIAGQIKKRIDLPATACGRGCAKIPGSRAAMDQQKATLAKKSENFVI